MCLQKFLLPLLISVQNTPQYVEILYINDIRQNYESGSYHKWIG